MDATRTFPPTILTRASWQMAPAERAALEGVLSQVKPELAIEIGTAEGGSLDRIAAHSLEVHAFDLTDGKLEGLPANATFHMGDSHELLPQVLGGFASEGRCVDFALVDGDHSSAGASADITALLDSPAVTRTLILAHDSLNPEVRHGIEAVAYGDYEKVVHVDLDFVLGRVVASGPFAGETWGGFALIVVDAGGDAAIHPHGLLDGAEMVRGSVGKRAAESLRRAKRRLSG